MSYNLVIEFSAETLVKAVNSKIRDGWIPQGGIVVRDSGDEYENVFYYQAMVKCNDRR